MTMCKMYICIYFELIMVFWLRFTTTQNTDRLHENYVGCFLENVDNQNPEHVMKSKTNFTIGNCIEKCYKYTTQTRLKMTFAAVNGGRRCICINNHGQQLHDRHCNVKCSGDQMQACGGSQATNIYSLYTVCGVGYFGHNCNQSCHCKRHLPCDRKTGICPDGCNDHWTGTNCNTIRIIQKQYIGCYGDNAINQSMDVKNPSGQTGRTTSNTNSIEFCLQICSTNNYTFAGMQYGYDCNCGETYSKYGDKTYDGKQVNCSSPCPANRTQICGGNFANSVYLVCPRGFYGRNCSHQCRCNGNPCRFNGSCLNMTVNSYGQGWTGSAGNIIGCRIDSGDCESDEMCASVDVGFSSLSMCRCKSGSYRNNNSCTPTYIHYLGCYKGSTAQYITVALSTKDELTIEFCILNCRQLNKTYSLLQGGMTCLCGDDYGQNTPDDECQVPCVGNKLQYCGGKNTVDGTPIYVVYTDSYLRQYIGCYKDTRIEAMEKKFSWPNAGNNTIESCIIHCAFNNYTYAGLQYGYDCFCGNSYDTYGPLPESKCNMTCSGNSSQICGGEFANSVYAVVTQCSDDKDCERNESCNVIDLHYANVSRCRCRKGFHRINKTSFCTDIDECKLEGTSSPCNTFSEYCVNSIGSYACGSRCKEGFTCMHEGELNITTAIGIIIASGTIMTISLLINVLLVVSRMKSANSSNPEPGNGIQSDLELISKIVPEQRKNSYDDTPGNVDENDVYENDSMEKRQIVQYPTSEYEALEQDDLYMNVGSYI